MLSDYRLAVKGHMLSDYQLAVICLGKRLAAKGQLPVPSDYRLAVKGQYQS